VNLHTSTHLGNYSGGENKSERSLFIMSSGGEKDIKGHDMAMHHRLIIIHFVAINIQSLSFLKRPYNLAAVRASAGLYPTNVSPRNSQTCSHRSDPKKLSFSPFELVTIHQGAPKHPSSNASCVKSVNRFFTAGSEIVWNQPATREGWVRVSIFPIRRGELGRVRLA
jgi:hypothetical protein